MHHIQRSGKAASLIPKSMLFLNAERMEKITTVFVFVCLFICLVCVCVCVLFLLDIIALCFQLSLKSEMIKIKV